MQATMPRMSGFGQFGGTANVNMGGSGINYGAAMGNWAQGNNQPRIPNSNLGGGFNTTQFNQPMPGGGGGGGYGGGGGGGMGGGPAQGFTNVEKFGVWTPEQINAQKQQMFAQNQQSLAGQNLGNQQRFAAGNMGPNSPALAALNNMNQNAARAHRDQVGTNIDWTAAQGNANMLAGTQVAQANDANAQSQNMLRNAELNVANANVMNSRMNSVLGMLGAFV